MYCLRCGTEVNTETCPKCGYDIKVKQRVPPSKPTKLQRTAEQKSPTITIILGMVFTGIGHFYLGLFKRGTILMILGIIFLSLNFANGYFAIISIPFWLYTIYDAYKKCKYYNHHITEYGRRPPW